MALFAGCNNKSDAKIVDHENNKPKSKTQIVTGAENKDVWLPLLKNKRVGLAVNATSTAFNMHIVDYMRSNDISIEKIFAAEHGFRGDAEPGKKIKDDIDKKTGIKIISLFGKNLKPTDSQLKDLDIVVFDMQDVGVRFFTFISTMFNLMEACARNNIPFVVLDRPNPLGDYVDGPVLEKNCKSFVGMLPIPIVHGLTVGELALMINGEKWLSNGITCDLKVVEIKNYSHKTKYVPPVKPSPNLPDYTSIRLYPSLCLFEATSVSVGRGTMFPFKVYGFPDNKFGDFSFVPQDIPGMQTNPLNEGKLCYGENLAQINPDNQFFTLKYFIRAYKLFSDPDKMVTRKRWLELLWGNKLLLSQLKQGLSEEEIKKSYQKDLNIYLEKRKKYLLYKL